MILISVLFFLISFSQIANSSKILIIYFSQTGKTEKLVNYITEIFNEISIFKIEPTTLYPKNYNSILKIAQEEQKLNIRPKIKNILNNVNDYEIILLCYPIWNSHLPNIVINQLEKLNFYGKIIFPFNTHDGSGIGNSIEDIKKYAIKANVKQGFPFSYNDINNKNLLIKKIKKWMKSNDNNISLLMKKIKNFNERSLEEQNSSRTWRDGFFGELKWNENDYIIDANGEIQYLSKSVVFDSEANVTDNLLLASTLSTTQNYGVQKDGIPVNALYCFYNTQGQKELQYRTVLSPQFYSLIVGIDIINFSYINTGIVISEDVIDCMCSFSIKLNGEIDYDKAFVNFNVNNYNDIVTLTLTTPKGNPLVSYVQKNLCIKDNLYGYYDNVEEEFIQLGIYWQNIEKRGDDLKPCSDFEPMVEPTPSPSSTNTKNTTNSTQEAPLPSPSSTNITYINNSTNIDNITEITNTNITNSNVNSVNSSEINNNAANYLASLGAYRIFYILLWIYRYIYYNYLSWVSILSGTLQVLLYADFFYLYLKNFKNSLTSDLPVTGSVKKDIKSNIF